MDEMPPDRGTVNKEELNAVSRLYNIGNKNVMK